MELYYNYDKCCFSLSNEGNTKRVFETHNREGRDNIDKIEEGRFKLIINSNFYPKSPRWEYLRANLFLDGVNLLPVSQAAHITKSSIDVSLQGLAFNQYGPGENKGKAPWTYYSKKMDWNTLLNAICTISENAEEWQKREFQSLYSLLNQKKPFESNPVILGKLIGLFTPYEKMLVSSLYPMIGINAIAAMNKLLGMIEEGGESTMISPNMLEYGDLIWKCIKYNSQPYNMPLI
ncbi:MAG: hypothetical protein IKO33_01105 [Bacteroidaceae bacterium]|nr:hypothetical protein [Bacteroidaceae bacterium]